MTLPAATYKIIKPNPNLIRTVHADKDEFYADWQNCRIQLTELSKIYIDRIFKLNIFVHDTEFESFLLKKNFIKEELLDIFGEKCPTFGILPQSPENPFQVTIELGIANSPGVIIYYRKYGNHLYTVLEKEEYKELWANGIEDVRRDLDTDIYSRRAFDTVNQILQSENMTFNNIVRQWNFIGNILGKKRNDQSLIQHYQVFNKVRHDFYSRYRSIPDFPAATGIGMNFDGVTIDICAIAPRKDMSIYSINNPKQANPYTYDQRVLSGGAIGGMVHKTPPEFERAKLIECCDISRLFISGTASIIGQETVGINDVEGQTKITIENIRRLIEKANLMHEIPQSDCYSADQCSYIRVYVKDSEDIPLVKSICADHFGNSPANYVQTDICRDGLLMEIEAELNLIN